MSSAESGVRQNETALARQAFTEQLKLLSLSFPALLLVGFIVLIPMGWLFWLSFLDADGFTLAHYERLLHPSYGLTLRTTFELAFLVTAVCVVLGYPLAYIAAQMSPRAARIVLLCVLFPFWTSLLVRTYAWLVLLQRRGQLNTWLQDWGLTDAPLRLVHNFTGTAIGMVHIMLPFMILPLYAAMKSIDENYMRAAANLGASPVQAFWQIHVPLSLPGLGAGVMVVFVLSLGFYVTPALLGGGRVMMWAMQIERSLAVYSDWGAASALGVVLLVITLAMLWLFSRLTGAVNAAAGGR
ncbi:putative spermidine/putrescine transport system permease protein [Pseudaminobacter salicylatoxidans]|uniref:Putative spermidine/putrescine transport system permease protein n=1 Tax=Pseudaminobacter salicylatoxidans TaxID=93369 RepID=A0A316C683_PSESE|nr:ABC transporter permease [Pseudaminobacter salicylatoxidans]PWJ82402.1 putative spermidine/putrescine transport system permease protein [Pseudaminobacter salicylatoxidans]